MGCILAKDVAADWAAESAGKRGFRKKEKNGRLQVKSRASVTKSESNKVEDGSVAVVERRKDRDGGDEHGSRRWRHSGHRKREKWRMDPRSGSFGRSVHGEQVAAGWPPWLSEVAGEAIDGWIPRRADTFVKINKIGQGTYSNVYKARDMYTDKIVALKKVRFDNWEPESVKFMAREINILRRLDHPNVVKLEGLATSRMTCSLYLVFEYMEHDLAGLAASPLIKFTEAQVKCYMQQLLSGLEHCHSRHVLHRDIKGSNLLLDNSGLLKIADFGLATIFDPDHKHPMTSRVVTLWYRAPELLMGATDYGAGIDLWSAGCILAELLAGKPIMPGRTEVEQLHKIFKLCGSPNDEYWKKLPHATLFKPQQHYKRCIAEKFKDFPRSSRSLIDRLLSINPADRQTATAALKSEFFTTEPYACDPSSLPAYPPSKEMDAKLRDDEARRLRAAGGKSTANGPKKTRARYRTAKGFAAPEANAELQVNIDRRRLITQANAKSKSEKFPPPHQDGALGFTMGSPQHLDTELQTPEPSFSATNFPRKNGPPMSTWSGPLVGDSGPGRPRRKKQTSGLPSKALTAAKANKGSWKDRNDVQIKQEQILA